ncbi:MAG: hypothetical protein WDW38_005943 [Sanguina aurantia]
MARSLTQGLPISRVEFGVSQAEAAARFTQHQQRTCNWLHAHSVLSRPPNSGASCLVPYYLPFWAFDVTLSAEVSGHIGFKAQAGTGTDMVWKEMEEPLQLSSHTQMQHTLPIMQTYASYTHTREIGEGAKLGAIFTPDDSSGADISSSSGSSSSNPNSSSTSADASSSSTSSSTASSSSSGEVACSFSGDGIQPTAVNGGGEGGIVTLEPPTMRQGIAWQLVYHALVHMFLREAEVAVKKATGAHEVKELHVKIQVHDRKARLLYLPAYVAHYQHGTRHRQGTTGIIVPQMFDALVGGTQNGSSKPADPNGGGEKSGAEPGFPGQAQCCGGSQPHVLHQGAAACGGGVAGAGLLAGELSLLLGAGPLSIIGAAEIATVAFITATLAGLWAQALPQIDRDRIAARQVRADGEFHKIYDAHESRTTAAAALEAAEAEARGLHAGTPKRDVSSDEYTQEPEQRACAEGLWRRQMSRRLERMRYVERRAEERVRRLAEAEVDARREQVFGRSSARRASASHIFGDEPGGGGGVNAAERFPSHRRDFLGYYKLLDIALEGEITSDTIKLAFKSSALKMHPDKFVREPAEEQRLANVRFQKLQIAYDVLRDPEKRSQYDRGQLMT